MKQLQEYLNESGGKFRMFYIWIYGAGTPMFILSAENEKKAYELANSYYNEWRKQITKNASGFEEIKNPISDIRELPGVYSDKPVCYDLFQERKGQMKNFCNS